MCNSLEIILGQKHFTKAYWAYYAKFYENEIKFKHQHKALNDGNFVSNDSYWAQKQVQTVAVFAFLKHNDEII